LAHPRSRKAPRSLKLLPRPDRIENRSPQDVTAPLPRHIAGEKTPAAITEPIKRFGEYFTDDLHIPPDAFDPNLDLDLDPADENAA